MADIVAIVINEKCWRGGFLLELLIVLSQRQMVSGDCVSAFDQFRIRRHLPL
jgi:hypothetical protein